METTKRLTNQELRYIFEDIIARKDRSALKQFVFYCFNVTVPDVSIIKGNNSPLDFVCDFFFERTSFSILHGPRSGGKTFTIAIVISLCAWYYQNIEIAVVAAVIFQAQRCYRYFSGYANTYPLSSIVNRQTMEKSETSRNTEVQILTGTVAGLNSPHPQVLFIDEVDLMSWAVLQQGLNTYQSTDYFSSQVAFASTKKSDVGTGSFQKIIDQSRKNKQSRLYRWSIFEVMQPFPFENDSLSNEIKDVLWEYLPDDLSKFRGYFSWTDLLSKFYLLDKETFEIELMCLRGAKGGLIYGRSFDQDLNTISDKFTPDLTKGQVYILEDLGFGDGHPDVALFCYIPIEKDKIIIFDELYMTKMGTDEIWEEIERKCNQHNIPFITRQNTGKITGWIADYHGLTEIKDRQLKGAPMIFKTRPPQFYEVWNGIKIVRRMFEREQILISDRCINLKTELGTYKKKKNLDGSYSNTIIKQNDHGPDALRYGCIELEPLLRLFKSDTINVIGKDENDTENYEKPITADLAGTTF